MEYEVKYLIGFDFMYKAENNELYHIEISKYSFKLYHNVSNHWYYVQGFDFSYDDIVIIESVFIQNVIISPKAIEKLKSYYLYNKRKKILETIGI